MEKLTAEGRHVRLAITHEDILAKIVTPILDIELDEAIDEVVDAALDTAKDFAEDGDLDVSLKERAEDVKDSLKDMTVKELKAQLKEKGLSLDGKKAELIERLLKAGDEE